MPLSLTEEDCRNCSWELAEITPDYRRWIGHGTHPVTGVEITVQKTEFLAEPALVESNAAARNKTDDQRWSTGFGSDKGGNMPLVRVGSIPLNKFYAEVVPRLKSGDDDHLKWWLSRDENQPFRTRRGNI